MERTSVVSREPSMEREGDPLQEILVREWYADKPAASREPTQTPKPNTSEKKPSRETVEPSDKHADGGKN